MESKYLPIQFGAKRLSHLSGYQHQIDSVILPLRLDVYIVHTTFSEIFLHFKQIEEMKIDVVLLTHTHYDHLDYDTAMRIGNRAKW